MKSLSKEAIKMRYMALLKRGIIDDDECESDIKKLDIDPCILKTVQKFDDYFVPGTVLISEKASYKLRIEYPVE